MVKSELEKLRSRVAELEDDKAALHQELERLDPESKLDRILDLIDLLLTGNLAVKFDADASAYYIVRREAV